MQNNKVAITGIGLITPAGHNVKDLWSSIIEGKSGIGPITRFDAANFPTRIAAEIHDFDPGNYLPRKEARRMDLVVQYACAAALSALADAQMATTNLGESCGVWVGSGIGGMATIESNHQALLNKGWSGINPFFIPMIIPNMSAGQIAIMTGAQGPCGCTVSACATGANSIGEAMRLIERGDVDVMLAGGSDASITPLSIGGFCAMKAMSTANDDLAKASRPFDLRRDGFVMGEGACVLVLENMEKAKSRGAHIYAELAGYGLSCDAFNVVQPEPSGIGAAKAMQMAIKDAGITSNQIDYINAHGTGTPANDQMETQAIKTVFGDHSTKLAISSTKPVTGHMLGAAGAVELAITVLAMVNGVIPPTMNLDIPDPGCDLDYTPNKAAERDITAALSNSLGFGGHNVALVVKKVETVDA
ncbi:MAG: beta-ketoacyl-ACP synthase II [Methylocystaceae bacterium]